jgi:uncharacterized protein (TIGR02270 family)
MALFGDDRAAVDAFKVGVEHPALSRRAIEIGMRAADPQWAREQVRSLASNETMTRQAIVSAGAFGDPTAVPWLLQMMERSELTRVAAESIATITGVDLERAEFKREAPAEPPEEDADDRDLRWPSHHSLAAWWEGERHRFTHGERYLAGRPVRQPEVLDVLRGGYQRQRQAAALEIARLRRDAIVFPTAARADWQQRRLGS